MDRIQIGDFDSEAANFVLLLWKPLKATFEEAGSRSVGKYISASTISDSGYHAANVGIEFGNAATKQSKRGASQGNLQMTKIIPLIPILSRGNRTAPDAKSADGAVDQPAHTN